MKYCTKPLTDLGLYHAGAHKSQIATKELSYYSLFGQICSILDSFEISRHRKTRLIKDSCLQLSFNIQNCKISHNCYQLIIQMIEDNCYFEKISKGKVLAESKQTCPKSNENNQFESITLAACAIAG